METIGRGVLDDPLEPVIGLAEGETRWLASGPPPETPADQLSSLPQRRILI
jgi:hypothetical protein